MQDLARLTASRDSSLQRYMVLIEELLQSQASELAEFDAETEALVSAAIDDEKDAVAQARAADRLALVNAHTSAEQQANDAAADGISAMLPTVNTDGDPAPGDGVYSIGTSSLFVDVVIAQVEVGSENNVQVFDVIVRCTPDCVFVTENGDMQAVDLQGQSIRRMYGDGTSDTFVVPSVTGVQLGEAVAVYAVQGVSTYCVCADSTVSALVRAS